MKKSDVFVYISGKYTGQDLFDTEQNIAVAKKVAIELANRKIKFFCPHTHSARFCCYCPNVEKDFWMDLDLAVVKRLTNCMVMVGDSIEGEMIPISNWKNSKGAIREKELALSLEQPVFDNLNNFFKWYKELK